MSPGVWHDRNKFTFYRIRVDAAFESGPPRPSGRYWRVRCTASHGGSAFGIYAVDFWRQSTVSGPTAGSEPASSWAPRLGPGHAHPGGDGELLEEHQRRLAAEKEPNPSVGEPMLRSMAWTQNNDRFRSSTWEGGVSSATGCLTTKASDRFCARNGSFADGRPKNGTGEWIVFDLQRKESLSKIRLVNYWSSNDSWSFKDLTIEVASELNGPFTPVASYAGLPRCSESKAVDLYLPAAQGSVGTPPVAATTSAPPAAYKVEGAGLAAVNGVYERHGDFRGSPRYKQVAAKEQHFNFVLSSVAKDIDTQGVLYWLGSGGGTRAYTNPHKAGNVVAKMSSRWNGSSPEWFVDHKGPDQRGKVINGITNPDPGGAWMSVDLGEGRQLLPNHYALRHLNRAAHHLLRSWCLEASNDEQEWTVLREHKNDSSLKDPYRSVAAWALQTERAFRHFRIRITGKTNTGDLYCCCSGIEFYGELRQTGASPPFFIRQGGSANSGYGILYGEESHPGAWAYFCEPSRDRKGLQLVPQAGFRWGSRVRGELIQVSEEGTTATDIARNPKKGDHVGGRYRVLAAETGVASGRHSWSVRILSKGRFCIGVATGEVASSWHEGNGRSLHQLRCAWTICVPSKYGSGHYEQINK